MLSILQQPLQLPRKRHQIAEVPSFFFFIFQTFFLQIDISIFQSTLIYVKIILIYKYHFFEAWFFCFFRFLNLFQVFFLPKLCFFFVLSLGSDTLTIVLVIVFVFAFVGVFCAVCYLRRNEPERERSDLDRLLNPATDVETGQNGNFFLKNLNQGLSEFFFSKLKKNDIFDHLSLFLSLSLSLFFFSTLSPKFDPRIALKGAPKGLNLKHKKKRWH